MERALEYLQDFAAQHHEGAQYGGDVDGHGEHHVFLRFYAEQRGADREVAAAADGEVFGEALEQAQEERFEVVHRMLGFGGCFFVLFFF